MGLYYHALPHAILVVDVENDRNGRPKTLKVAESNWAKSWSNPTGQVPWLRTVKTRTIGISSGLPAGHKLIDYGR